LISLDSKELYNDETIVIFASTIWYSGKKTRGNS